MSGLEMKTNKKGHQQNEMVKLCNENDPEYLLSSLKLDDS